MADWLLYGAYGYTGQLVIEEALRRDHRPLLAGRNPDKLRPLAERYKLDFLGFDLVDTAALHEAVAGVDLVLHAAGPFSQTSQPMVQACLAGGRHYLDITGEIAVFERIFGQDQQARQSGVALIPGVGFDVVPTDCLAVYVAGQVPEASELELAIVALEIASAGTTKTMIEGMASTGYVRRGGKLVALPFGQGGKEVRFSDGRDHYVLPIPWGDLATAWHSTGIPNITTYKAFPPQMARNMRFSAAIGRPFMAWRPIRRLAQSMVGRFVKGPDAQYLRQARAYVWARATNDRGEAAEAWLETMEGYRLTAIAAVRAVERTLSERPAGALTPAQAFGPDFVLELGETERLDRLAAD